MAGRQASEIARVAIPTSSVGEQANAPAASPPVSVPRPRGRTVLRLAAVAGALWLFVLALQLIKASAAGLQPLLDGALIDGVAGHLGFGWLGSYAVMSGSPVAAVAMSLFAGDALSEAEAFAMINGSRLGASLIVLVAGFVAYVTGRRNPDGLYIGVVALLTALTLWLPVLPIGLLVLDQGWLSSADLAAPGALGSFVSTVSDPVVEPLEGNLPDLVLVVAGIGALAGAFLLFDRVLPSLESPGPRLEALSQALQRRYAMFGFGALITLVTLSVSLSVTILVPLALKGYVRRDRVIPYVMGANIATWVDTLFAALLLDAPGASTIVFTQMLTGGAVSLVVLIAFYGPYTRAILWAARAASSSRRNLALMMGCFFAAPALLLLV